MNDPRPVPKPVALGATCALLSVIFGFLLGGAFGAAEDKVKGRLEASGQAALESVYKGDAAAKDAVVKKSWQYLLRAHLHGGAIGAAALGGISTLVLLTRLDPIAQYSALAFGLGGLIYSAFWLLAGLKAPGLGSTGAAKQALEFMAIPGAGLSILGAVGTLACVVRDAVLGKR
jgi:hypothetical protein